MIPENRRQALLRKRRLDYIEAAKLEKSKIKNDKETPPETFPAEPEKTKPKVNNKGKANKNEA